MTKEEYIEKQKDILERAIEDTFKVDPVKLMLVSRLLNPKMRKETIRCKCKCGNNKFYVSHIIPAEYICSECFADYRVNSGYVMATDYTKTED